MSKFCKPAKKGEMADMDLPDHAEDAVTRCLADSQLEPKDVEQAVCGNMFFGTGAGQRSLYPLGFYNIPIYNVNNACATGSNALMLAKQFVASGMNECCLALGVEKMQPGSLGGEMGGGATMLDYHLAVMSEKFDVDMRIPLMPQMFGNAGREHMAKYGTTKKHFAMVGEKNHRHSANNPYAQFRDVYTLEQVEKSGDIYEPLTKLQCSPTSDGAGCAIVCSEEFVIKHGLQGQAVEIVGQAMTTDSAESFDDENVNDRSCIDVVGFPMAQNCANQVYSQAGLGPEDVQVVELHDCFSCNELITYEALGLCPEGKGGELIESGDATFGGKYVINPSGGLISKGHPLGATGLAQCAELCWQLRGECGPRQVAGAKVALQHNLGLGGACVVTMYKKPAEWAGAAPKRKASGAMGFDDEGNAVSGMKSKL